MPGLSTWSVGEKAKGGFVDAAQAYVQRKAFRLTKFREPFLGWPPGPGLFRRVSARGAHEERSFLSGEGRPGFAFINS